MDERFIDERIIILGIYQPYLEANRQLRYEIGAWNALYVHLALMPYLDATGELKTKPTQHSVKTLLSFGLQPDVLVCRLCIGKPPVSGVTHCGKDTGFFLIVLFLQFPYIGADLLNG